MNKHLMTAQPLEGRGVDGEELARRLESQQRHHVIGDVYCDRPPTTIDKCRAVGMWRQDAVLSHFTAAWLHGIWHEEPKVLDAYVSSVPSDQVPAWLRRHVEPYESYAGDPMLL